MYKLAFVLIISMLLSACGFQLRGGTTLPEDSQIMFVDAPRVLKDELVVHLEDGGAEIIDNPEKAEVLLRIERTTFDRRTLSVDPDTGKEREFELTYSVKFSARKNDGSWLLRSQTVTLLRDYVFDEDALLGKSREQGTLKEEMHRDAARQILVRLASAVEG